MKYSYDTVFQISNKEVMVHAQFTCTGGAPATWDDPAEAPEIEFHDIELSVDSKAWFAAPDWIYDIFTNDDEILAECCSLADDDHYED